MLKSGVMPSCGVGAWRSGQAKNGCVAQGRAASWTTPGHIHQLIHSTRSYASFTKSLCFAAKLADWYNPSLHRTGFPHTGGVLSGSVVVQSPLISSPTLLGPMETARCTKQNRVHTSTLRTALTNIEE